MSGHVLPIMEEGGTPQVSRGGLAKYYNDIRPSQEKRPAG